MISMHRLQHAITAVFPVPILSVLLNSTHRRAMMSARRSYASKSTIQETVDFGRTARFTARCRSSYQFIVLLMLRHLRLLHGHHRLQKQRSLDLS